MGDRWEMTEIGVRGQWRMTEFGPVWYTNIKQEKDRRDIKGILTSNGMWIKTRDAGGTPIGIALSCERGIGVDRILQYYENGSYSYALYNDDHLEYRVMGNMVEMVWYGNA